MAIPEFPQFKSVDMSCRGDVNDFLSKYPLAASEYTFTNIFAYRFRSAYNFKLSFLNDNLIIIKDKEPVSAFCPVGGPDIPAVMEQVFDYLADRNDLPYFERVPESFVGSYLKNSEYDIREEREHFDYIYNVTELIELTGSRFHDKKNRVNRFRDSYEYEYLPLTPDLIKECLRFEHYWCEERDCEKEPGLKKERCAIIVMLKDFEVLGVRGGVIRIDGRISALTLGEKILPDTFVVHVEKASSAVPGLYQVINQEFLMHEADDCVFVNREQDLGLKGLRKAKMSYNPVGFVRKYRIQEKRRS